MRSAQPLHPPIPHRCERKVATFLCVTDPSSRAAELTGGVAEQNFHAAVAVASVSAVMLFLVLGVVLRQKYCRRKQEYHALGQLLGHDESTSDLMPHEEDRVMWRVKHSRLGRRLRAHFRRRSSSTDANGDESETQETGDEYEIFGVGAGAGAGAGGDASYDLHNVSSSMLDADLFGEA